MSEGCTRCGGCLNCSSPGETRSTSGYVRILGSGSEIGVFRCKQHRGCFAQSQIDSSVAGCKTCANPTLELTAGCQVHYTGHFCATCVEDYEMERMAAAPGTSARCVPCDSDATQRGLITLLVLIMAVTMLTLLRKRIISCLMALMGNDLAGVRAMLRSVWQPTRIIIT